MQALQLVGIRKSYGDVRVVRGVSVSFETGQVHAVLGENGAGKTTLLRVAAGVIAPDLGEVHVEGRKLYPHTAAEAVRRGVGMVQEDFGLVLALTVLENIVLGAEPSRWGRLDLASARQRAANVVGELGAPLPLDAEAWALGPCDRQRVAIARVLYRNARVLVFDEPASVLTRRELDGLYAIMRRLAASGRAVIVVTHDVDEVIAHADAASILRRGELVSSRALPPRGKRRNDAAELASDVAGGEPFAPIARAGAMFGGPALVVKEVRVAGALDHVAFEVRSGEIVGLACVEGNGQRELVRVIAGLDRPDGGMVWVKTDDATGQRGAPAVVHEDEAEAIVLDASARDNLVLGEHRSLSLAGILRVRRLDEEARRRADRAMIRAPSLDAPARSLSPSERRRVAVARALARVEAGAPALVLAYPTRGVDLATARWIHEQILDVALRRRCAVLVVSADLSELRGLADRVLVLSRGRVGEVSSSATHTDIGFQMVAPVGLAGSGGFAG